MFFSFQIRSQADSSAIRKIFVDKYSTEKGLSQSMITCVYEDPNGILWLGTGADLNYFDGYKMTVVQFSNRRDLGQNLVRKILAINASELLLFTSSEIGIFNKADFTFHSVYSTQKSEPVHLTTLKDKFLLCWSADNGFFVYYQTNSLRVFFPIDLLNTRIKEEPKFATESNGGEILLSTWEGLYIWRIPKEPEKILNTESAPIIVADKSNVIHVVDKNSVYLWDGISLIQYLKAEINKPIQALFSDDDKLWIVADAGFSLLAFKDSIRSEIKMVRRWNKYQDSISPCIKFLQKDNRRNLFIGTDGDGLLIHNTNKFDFDVAQIGFTKVLSASKNYLWAGTHQNGLWRLSKNLREGKKVTNSHLSETEHIFSITSEKDENLLVVTNKSLVLLNEHGAILDSWTTEKDNFFVKAKVDFIGRDSVMLQIARSENFKSFTKNLFFTINAKELMLCDSINRQAFVHHLTELDNQYLHATSQGLFLSKKMNSSNLELLANGKFYSTARCGKLIYAASSIGFLICLGLKM
jgi:ligand-binding sensor domain-containing protein